jgi:hypothetical protein
MKSFFLVVSMVLLLSVASTSDAGSITLNIDSEREDLFLQEGRLIHYRSGPLLYDGVQIGTATALLYFVSATPGQPAPDAMVSYEVIKVKIEGFSGFIATTVVPPEVAGGHPAILVDKATGMKVLSGTLTYFYGGSTTGLGFTFDWAD